METITLSKVYLCLNLVLGPMEDLHPWSESVLSSWWNGNITEMQFRRYLSWPNSDYNALSSCILTEDQGV